MIITEYISKNIQTLTKHSTIANAKQLMLEQLVNHLPVVSRGKLVGNIGLNSIKNIKQEESIKDHLLELTPFYLPDTTIIFDTVKIFSENETNIVPVINGQEQLLGVVLEETIIDEFSSVPFITDFGVFITITTPIKKYSISEISNIVESNNGKILGLIVVKEEEDATQITLKIRAENLNSIGDTFERYGYQISNKYFEDSKQELLRHRYSQFQKFIEV